MKKKKDRKELLSQNYLEMDEEGKEKLKEVSVKILEIHKTVNEKDKEVKKPWVTTHDKLSKIFYCIDRNEVSIDELKFKDKRLDYFVIQFIILIYYYKVRETYKVKS